VGEEPLTNAELTPPPHRRTLASVPITFEAAFARVKQLVADVRGNEKSQHFYTNWCNGLERQIDALGDVLYALTPAEIKIVKGAADLEIQKQVRHRIDDWN
jgi:hypothetical protein